MKKVLQKPYVYWLIGIFVVYLMLNIFVSGFYNTIPLIIAYSKAVNWVKLGLSVLLTLATSFLVALTMVYTYIRYKERKDCKKVGTLAGVGAVGGLIVGVCPLCVAGIFPLILGLLGISFTFASLPFQGLEIQFVIVIVLLISLYLLNKRKFKRNL